MISTLKHVYYFIKDYMKFQFMGFLLTMLFAVTMILSPIASKYLIDDVLNTSSKVNIYSGIFIFFVACISQPIVSFFKDIVFMKMGLNISLDISEKMFFKIIQAPVPFFDHNRKGDIISRIINDGNMVSSFVTNFFVVYIKNVLIVLMTLGCMIFISFKITIFVILILGAFFIINGKLVSKFEALSLCVSQNNDALYSYVEQSISSIISIKSFVAEERIIQNYHVLLSKIRHDNAKMKLLSIVINNFSNFVVILSLSFIYGFGAIEITNKNMTLGAVVGSGLYFQLVVPSIYSLADNGIEINTLKPIFKRMFDYLNMEEEPKCTAIHRNFNGLKLKNVHFEYENEGVVIENLTIDFPKKGIVGIVGESGSGKSTLANLIMKFYKPTLGEIRLGELSYADCGVEDIRQNIGYVPQDIQLFNLSIKENFEYANSSIDEKDISELLKIVKLSTKVEGLEKGYETLITENVNLSGGERQRLGIALAIAKKPSVLVLDEPTSALDSENEIAIINVINEISRSCLVILITHKMSTLKYADKVYEMSSGKLSELISINNGRGEDELAI